MHRALLVTRLVGLWILVGAALKLLYGTPMDLPQLVQDLPLALGTKFRLALTVEFLVGAFALLRPARGWLPALLLASAFLIVLGSQVAAGASSCGCFGAALAISPVVMLVIDGVSILLLLVTRPWRAPPEQAQAPWTAVVVILLSLGALPWLLDREHSTAQPGGGFVVLDVPSYQGKRLSDTDLWPLLSEDQRIEDGLIVLWRASCEDCAEHLDNLHYRELGDRTVVLLEAPPVANEEGAEPVVKVLPEGPWVKSSLLPEGTAWIFSGPGHVEVTGGVVTVATQGHDSLELDK